MTYPLILEIITSFYETVKRDVMIGYHFRFIEDFDHHIPRIADFWNLQLNGELHKKENLPFNLLKTHQDMGIKKAEVGRWIMLFEKNLEHFEKQNKISLEQIEVWNKKVKIFREKIEAIV